MSREEYLSTLREELGKQNVSNIDNMVEYYDEMLCDRMEDGMTEEEAVNSMESIADIVSAAILDRPVPVLVKEKVQKSHEKAKNNGNGWLWIVLAVIGFPVWLPLMITAVVLILTFFIVFWVLVLSLFIVLISIGISSVICLVTAFSVFVGFVPIQASIVLLGAALLLGGLCILIWNPCWMILKGSGKIFSALVLSVKHMIFG